jgi:hypothetical protein
VFATISSSSALTALSLLPFLPIENHLASSGSRAPFKARQIQPFEADLDELIRSSGKRGGLKSIWNSQTHGLAGPQKPTFWV